MAPRIPKKTIGAAIGRVPCQTPRPASLPWRAAQSAPSFSTTPPRELTKPQRFSRTWFKWKGSQFKTTRGSPNYLGQDNKPFPTNPAFKSQPVLSAESREEIWRRVVAQGETIKSVSAEFGVDMRRVAAVVRLKEVEKTWAAEVSSVPLQRFFLFSSLRPLPRFRTFHDEHIKQSISLEDNKPCLLYTSPSPRDS